MIRFAISTTRRLALLAACASSLAGMPVAAQSTESAAAAASAGSMPAPVDDRLFRDLGGQPAIDRIVADFVPRLVADPRLGEFFKHSNLPHLKEMLALQFCAVSGGPCVYTGLPMKLAHQDMHIAKRDFNALVEVLQTSMDAQGIPFATQNRLLARLAPMHRDIVNVP